VDGLLRTVIGGALAGSVSIYMGAHVLNVHLQLHLGAIGRAWAGRWWGFGGKGSESDSKPIPNRNIHDSSIHTHTYSQNTLTHTPTIRTRQEQQHSRYGCQHHGGDKRTAQRAMLPIDGTSARRKICQTCALTTCTKTHILSLACNMQARAHTRTQPQRHKRLKRTLECHVLEEVCRAVVLVVLETAAGVNV